MTAITEVPPLSFQTIGDPKDTNFPKDEEGRVYHLGLKVGELANRIIMVGDPDRAELLVESFDSKDYFQRISNRGFITYTGTVEGKPVSVMAMGMGFPMMDFAVRESRAITEGPLYIIRLGSCGTPREDVKVGTVSVAQDSFCVQTDYDAYKEPNKPCFKLTKPVTSDPKLHQLVVETLKQQNHFPVVEGTDATADSFYSSQGREDSAFDDRNTTLIDGLLSKYPDTTTLQMETFQLFFLSQLAAKDKEIHAAACAIVLANRKTNEFLSNDKKKEIEKIAGRILLKALANFKI